MNPELSLQDQYAAKSICFGCGPANAHGLQIKSFVDDDQVIAHYQPQPYHNAFPGVLNGGIIGALLDCHCNWAASWFLMQRDGLSHPPCCVTADFSVQLRRPTPMDQTLTIIACLDHTDGNKAVIDGRIEIHDKVFDTMKGTFVAVNEDHPAYHRW